MNGLRIVSNIFLMTGYIYLMYYLLVTDLSLYVKLPIVFTMGIFDSSFIIIQYCT